LAVGAQEKLISVAKNRERTVSGRQADSRRTEGMRTRSAAMRTRSAGAGTGVTWCRAEVQVQKKQRAGGMTAATVAAPLAALPALPRRHRFQLLNHSTAQQSASRHHRLSPARRCVGSAVPRCFPQAYCEPPNIPLAGRRSLDLGRHNPWHAHSTELCDLYVHSRTLHSCRTRTLVLQPIRVRSSAKRWVYGEWRGEWEVWVGMRGGARAWA
jgi:hypothetical protein